MLKKIALSLGAVVVIGVTSAVTAKALLAETETPTTCQGAGCYGGPYSCMLEYTINGDQWFVPCPAGKP